MIKNFSSSDHLFCIMKNILIIYLNIFQELKLCMIFCQYAFMATDASASVVVLVNNDKGGVKTGGGGDSVKNRYILP